MSPLVVCAFAFPSPVADRRYARCTAPPSVCDVRGHASGETSRSALSQEGNPLAWGETPRESRRWAVSALSALTLTMATEVLMPVPSAAAQGTAPIVPQGQQKAGTPGRFLFQGAPAYGKGNFDFLSQRATSSLLDFDNPGFGYDGCFGLCSDKQLYYPTWMEGEWEVTSEYMGKAFPKGVDYVYRNVRSGSARSEKEEIGDRTQHLSRYIKVAKRQYEPLSVMQDRIQNTKSLLNAYAGYERVVDVEYSPDKDPTRMVMRYPTVDPRDMRPLPPKRTEVFINNRDAALSANAKVFASSEFFRAVTLGPGSSAVADSENSCVFTYDADSDSISGVQRSMIYLVPSPNSREGDLYMQVGGKAVAVYDYKLSMRRVVSESRASRGGGEGGSTRERGGEEAEEENEEEEE